MNTLTCVKRIIFNPTAQWDAVARDMPDALLLWRKILLPLCLLAPMAIIVGMLFFNTRWNTQFGYSLLGDRIPAVALSTYISQIASVYLLAAVFYGLARTEARSPTFLVTLQVAALGSVPILLSGATLVIPSNVIFTMASMLYSFYLYHLGVVRLIGVKPEEATIFVGVAMFCMLVLSGVIAGIASALGLL